MSNKKQRRRRHHHHHEELNPGNRTQDQQLLQRILNMLGRVLQELRQLGQSCNPK